LLCWLPYYRIGYSPKKHNPCTAYEEIKGLCRSRHPIKLLLCVFREEIARGLPGISPLVWCASMTFAMLGVLTWQVKTSNKASFLCFLERSHGFARDLSSVWCVPFFLQLFTFTCIIAKTAPITRYLNYASSLLLSFCLFIW
jgi:hypothetical protein